MAIFSKETIPLASTNSFEKIILDYLSDSGFLKDFYDFEDDLHGIKQRIDHYSNRKLNRIELVREIKQQYHSSGITDIHPKIKENIELLSSESTFTITAGHQLNIFGGPLYVLYKLISVINISEKLKSRFPDKNFVPVYWMATEDHDTKEISHLNLFGKNYQWENEWKGITGKMPMDGIEKVIYLIQAAFGNSEYATDLMKLMQDAYGSSKNLGEANRKWHHSILGKYGLIIIDGDVKFFKESFADILTDELLNESSSIQIHNATERLSSKYVPQVKPREINLFYLGDNFRERIIKQGDRYKILNKEIDFSTEELEKEIKNHPERFSPNVVMRPVYQECILPNIIFVGGPAEIAYWLELKSLFDHHKIPMPVLILRSCLMLIDKSTKSRMVKFNLSVDDLFQPADEIIRKHIHGLKNGHPSVEGVSSLITDEFFKLGNAVTRIDPTLVAAVQAESQKVSSSLLSLQEKIIRSLKKKNETDVNQIRKLKEKLFPNGKLQERHDSFIQYYLTWGNQFVEMIKEHADPLKKEFVILTEN